MGERDEMAIGGPYQPGRGIQQALLEMERGRAHDPAAVDACARLFREKRFEFAKP